MTVIQHFYIIHPGFLILFCLLAFNKVLAQGAQPKAVSTFQCLGIYWSPPNGDLDTECQVTYRKFGTQAWQKALSLWFDDRNKEYRGSIVNLQPGTTYFIELKLQDTQNSTVTFVARTWDEEFPIVKTIYLPAFSDKTYVINESGSSGGYILYTFPVAGSTIIDVANNQELCISIPENSSYIIIRGLILRGAEKHAIQVADNCHDIVIEKCDISNWGNNDSTGFGVKFQSAIASPSSPPSLNIERMIIQRNKIHHPRSNSNSWAEARQNPGGDPFHPAGPHAITLSNSAGNHVIRYNEIYSDEDHYFADIFGAGSNFSFSGFPNRDSDIHGNQLERCWNDGIEAEGANQNVRIWGNYIDKTFVKIAIAGTSVGPLYIWRNVANTSRESAIEPGSDLYGRGPFIKAGGQYIDGIWYGSGRTYVLHNTVLQEEPEIGIYPLGCDSGILANGGNLYNLISRNNIFTNYQPDRFTFTERPENPDSCGTNDFDYDLYTGLIKNDCANVTHQSHGLHLLSNDSIIFNPDDAAGPYALAPGTPGHDAGLVIPNFNDDYTGSAPDMGAIESSSTTSVSETTTIVPFSFKLLQNFPNPFNPQTTIEYQLPKESEVNLQIYNILGQRVATLVDEKQPSGSFAKKWHGKNDSGTRLPSGIYLYRLKTENFVEIKKLALVR